MGKPAPREEPTHAAQVEFLVNVQRLLRDGKFTATYKYALLHSLADLAVEHGDDTGAELEIQLDWIAERFLELYEPHARLYPLSNGRSIQLKQNTGKQAAVLNELRKAVARKKPASPRLAIYDTALRGAVRQTIRREPLPKLQMVGGTRQAFLYDEETAGPKRVVLRPGVAYCLRKFHSLVTGLARDAWVEFIRRLNAADLEGGADLERFLFHPLRTPVARFEGPLREIQDDKCLYCERRIKSNPHVDHFVPWSWYANDTLPNLVLAHGKCNSAKSDRLASVGLLRAWAERNTRLLESASAPNLAQVQEHSRTLAIAGWAYGYALSASALVWTPPKTLAKIESGWEAALDPYRSSLGLQA